MSYIPSAEFNGNVQEINRSNFQEKKFSGTIRYQKIEDTLISYIWRVKEGNVYKIQRARATNVAQISSRGVLDEEPCGMCIAWYNCISQNGGPWECYYLETTCFGESCEEGGGCTDPDPCMCDPNGAGCGCTCFNEEVSKTQAVTMIFNSSTIIHPAFLSINAYFNVSDCSIPSYTLYQIISPISTDSKGGSFSNNSFNDYLTAPPLQIDNQDPKCGFVVNHRISGSIDWSGTDELNHPANITQYYNTTVAASIK